MPANNPRGLRVKTLGTDQLFELLRQNLVFRWRARGGIDFLEIAKESGGHIWPGDSERRKNPMPQHMIYTTPVPDGISLPYSTRRMGPMGIGCGAR